MGSRFSRASNALPPSLAKVVQKSESEGDLLQTTLRNYKNLDFRVKTTEIKTPNVSKQTTFDIDTASKPVSGTVQSERNKKSREIKKEDVSRIMPKQDPKGKRQF